MRTQSVEQMRTEILWRSAGSGDGWGATPVSQHQKPLQGVQELLGM